MSTGDLSSTFINKIPQTGSTHSFLFKSMWGSNEVDLQILDYHQSLEWEGLISVAELKQSAEELEISYEEFYDECKEALTHNGGIEHFEYSMEKDKFTLTKTDEFRIKYLEVNMKQACGLQQSMNLNSVDLIAALRSDVFLLESENNELNHNYATVVKTLEKCLQEKNNIEKKLLRRFSVLLNSKKDKIAELQNLLVEKSNKLEEPGLSGNESNQRKSTEAPGSSGDNDDPDFMMATQLMTQPEVTLPKRKKLNAAENIVAADVSEQSSSSVIVEEFCGEEIIMVDQDLFDLLIA